ncbi:MAG: phosphoglycerate mutase family protein [Candidatus Dormiibacterota bacterium]
MGTFYVVRHAKAGSRGHWTGDDRLRPLSKKGIEQAEKLVSIFEPFPITAVFSSPFLRCVQTVEPLARAPRMSVKQSAALAEGHGLSGAMEFIGDSGLDHVVLCTHGDIVWELVEELVKRHVIKAGEGGFEKGSTWVVEVEGGSFMRARFISAP